MNTLSSFQSVKLPLHVKRCVLGAAAVFCFGTASAQWTVEPILKVGAEKDDNATLSVRTDDVIDVTGLLYEASFRFNYDSPITDFYITPEVASRNYNDFEEILDTTDIFLNSRYTYTGISNIFNVDLRFDEQTVRTAERSDADLDVDDPEQIPDDGTGVPNDGSEFLRLRDDRQQIRITPEWRHLFSETNAVFGRVNYIDTNYDDAIGAFLNDYSDIRLTLGYERRYSERALGLFEISGRRYEVEQDLAEADGIGAMAGLEYQLSPVTTTRFLVGVEDTDSSVSETDPSFVADMSLQRRLETINVLALYRRSVSASGVGRLSVRDTVALNLSRLLTEKVTAGIGVRAYQTNSLDEVATIDERDYVQLRAQLIWNLTPAFSTEFDYRYTVQKRSSLEESSNSNLINVWFVYQPNSQNRRFIRQ